MMIIVFLLFIYFAVSALIAAEFYEIAEKKGYHERKYFWYSFLFSVAGWLLVIALPEKKADSSKVNSNEKAPFIGDFPSQSFPDNAGIRQCPKCGVCHDSDAMTCPACGNKYEI